tara:strand:- start:218 stop:406 length:189 start_codon:yes stop_codon:yes gene_type:complete
LLVVVAALVKMDKVVLGVLMVVVDLEVDQIVVVLEELVAAVVVDHQMIEMVDLVTLGIMVLL